MSMSNLSDWVINYCHLKEEWRAVKREHYPEMFNSSESKNVIRFKNVGDMIKFISITNGDKTKINKLIKKDANY